MNARFKNVLIANRGEIACRIMRTAKAIGLETIAVYSEADADAPHAKMADKAFLLGPAPAAESYLNADRVLDAARETGAQAIHPGYGFLSENAPFAQACADAGLIFIGPDPDAIDLMGDKAKAKRRVIDAGAPCVPGYQGEDQSDATLLKEADKIGFPIMVKAAAGGGGRGMRLVESKDALAGALQRARSEAENAFGSSTLILERALIEPRHVEIQIFADAHGNVIHFGERDCSVQRRHQKVLEEAPCPVMTPPLRKQVGEAAVKIARDIGYVGAGTVEFLLDKDGDFYFLEMNTRLQVEHPVTEMATGVDLVALQFRVAQGDALDITQDQVMLNGHAIEARLYAEDVGRGFLPATGPVDLWAPSQRARIDAGVETGGEVSSFYDPMIAKIIAHGATRENARRKLIVALKETVLFGVASNKKFLIDTLEKPAFVNGEATTGFVASAFTEAELAAPAISTLQAVAAAVLLHTKSQQQARNAAVYVPEALLGWSSATKLSTPYRFAVGENFIDLSVTQTADGAFDVTAGGETVSARIEEIAQHSAVIGLNGARETVYFNLPGLNHTPSKIQIDISGCVFDLQNLNAVAASAQDAAGAGDIVAPMHGVLVDLFVAEGAKVAKGDRLAVLEAMKMQHELISEVDGEVASVHARPGAQVAADAVLIEITPAD